MIKRLILSLVVLVFGLSVAWAAPAGATTGKIAAIDGNKVQITLDAEKPAWVRKGAVVKVANEAGPVDNAAKVSELSDGGCTITVKDASAVKAGDSVTLQKGKSTTGC